MKSYRSKQIYKAVQYTGENKGECNVVETKDGRAFIYAGDQAHRVAIGEWIVFTSEFYIYSINSDESFKEKFEEVSE